MKKLLICLACVILLFSSNSFAEDKFTEQIRSGLLERLVQAGADKDIARLTLYDSRVQLYPELLNNIGGEGYNYFDPHNGIFTEDSLFRGKKVLAENAWVLDDIEREYGIRKEILVSIFRVETNLGKNTGKYIVVNSLLTWVTSGTRRTKWAEKELTSYLIICKDNKWVDPLSVYGSTHGAFGLVQFIPSSFLLFAVDGNKDGRIDLFDFTDAMASVANYLRLHNKGRYPLKNSIYAYNHEWSYVKAVISYADSIRMRSRQKF